MLKPAEMAKLAATAMDEKMAKEITVMRTTDVTVLADYFILCTASSTPHIKTISDAVEHVLTEAGEPLVSAAVLFLPMDRRSRKLTLTADIPELPEVMLPGEANIPSLRQPFPHELSRQCVRTVCAHEIDENGHMNNTCYLKWASELCDQEFHAQHKPRSIWVQYISELTEGQRVTLEYAETGQRFFIRGTANQADSFLAVIQYESCDPSAAENVYTK